MKKFIVAASVIFLAACSSADQEVQNPQPGPSSQHVEVRTAGSIAFPCVKWNDRIYQITKTQVTDAILSPHTAQARSGSKYPLYILLHLRVRD